MNIAAQHLQGIPVGDQINTYFDVRWMCPTCGRFIAEAAISSEDFRDDSAYYGVRSEIRATCGRCGEVEPQCRPVREIPICAPLNPDDENGAKA